MAAPGSPAPPVPTEGTAPDGAPRSASGQPPGQGNDGFWGRFPDVPVELRAQLEPHLKNVQGHVTRLEQQLAPFKGMSPQAITGLANFARQFDANPKAMFLAMAEDLQRRGIIHENLDLAALQAGVDGQEPDAYSGSSDGWDQYGYYDDSGNWVWYEGYEYMGEGDGTDEWADAPAWAQELKGHLTTQQEKEAEQKRSEQEALEDRMLTKSLETMSSKLKEAGYPEDYLTEARMTAQLLTHGGNTTAAIQDMIDGRNQILGTIVKPKPSGEVDLPRGVPKHGKSSNRSDGLKRRDPIKAAGAGAEQFLRRAAQEAQQ